MVQVNNLKGKSAAAAKGGIPTPAKPSTVKEKQTITKADVGTIDAATLTKSSQSKAIATAAKGVNLPAFMQKDSRLPALVPGMETGYVGFADNRNKIFSSLQANGIEEGDPYLARNNTYTLCKPLNYYLMIGESFRSIMLGEAGEWVYCTRDINAPTDLLWDNVADSLKASQKKGGLTLEAKLPDYKFFQKNLQEHYVLLMIVLLDNGELVPVKGDFRGTKKGVAEGPIRAVEAAAGSEWLDKSDAHRVSGQFPDPFGRVLHTVSTYFKSGKKSGYSFYVAEAVSAPPTIEQMEALLEALKSEQFTREMGEAHKNYTARIEFLDNIIAESNKA